MAASARTLNPGIEIILRTENEEECDLMREAGKGAVFYPEDELAKGVTQRIGNSTTCSQVWPGFGLSERLTN